MALNKVAAVLVVVIVALGGVFAYYYVVSSGTISSQSNTISSQSSTISSQAALISLDEGKIANLTQTIAKDVAQISNLTNIMHRDQAKIAALTNGYAMANSTIALQAAQIVDLQTSVTTLQNTISTLNIQVAGLQSQVATLQADVAALTDVITLKVSQLESASQPHSIPGNGNVTVISFSALYAGYVLVNMTAISDINNVGIVILDQYSAGVHGGHYTGISVGFLFSTIPDGIAIPVTPGTITVFLLNLDPTTQSASISVTYFS